jgi:hypothetical protein
VGGRMDGGLSQVSGRQPRLGKRTMALTGLADGGLDR